MATQLAGMVAEHVRKGWLMRDKEVADSPVGVVMGVDEHNIILMNTSGWFRVRLGNAKRVTMQQTTFLKKMAAIPDSVVGVKAYKAIQKAVVVMDDEKPKAACDRVGKILFGDNYGVGVEVPLIASKKREKKDKTEPAVPEGEDNKIDQ